MYYLYHTTKDERRDSSSDSGKASSKNNVVISLLAAGLIGVTLSALALVNSTTQTPKREFLSKENRTMLIILGSSIACLTASCCIGAIPCKSNSAEENRPLPLTIADRYLDEYKLDKEKSGCLCFR
jgi:hypothetical protein